MQDSFERSMTIASAQETVWALLHDVDELASCSSHLGAVTTVEINRLWKATLEDRVGPFKLSALIDVEIISEDPMETVAIRASGQDRGLGTRLVVEAAVTTRSADEPGTVDVVMQGSYDITGRVATLGAAVVRRQANSMLDEFWINLGDRLTGSA